VLRQHRDLSQNELASAAGLSPSRIREIEETRRLREDEAELLAKALRVTKCAFQNVRSRFRGCDDAMADTAEG
jgi:transcriptional regulator with XRE-family HTH domain